MSSIRLHVEVLPGTGIKEAIEEAKAKAIFLNICCVTFSFNGATIDVFQDSDVEDRVNYFRRKLRES